MFATRIVSKWNKFRTNKSGATAIMFGLAILPLVMFTGAALDYSRLIAERTRFQTALDTAALSVIKGADKLSMNEVRKRVENYFVAAYGVSGFGPGLKINVTRNNGILTVSGSTDVEMTLMKVAGYEKMPIGASTSVTAGRKKLEIALVLDNTGSMDWNGKMPALKAAVSDLIDELKKEVTDPGDVKMAIIPFNTEVKIDTAHHTASWLRWDVTLDNTDLSLADREPPLPADWQGCVADRDQPYDISSAPAGIHISRYVASKCHASGLAKVEPLTTNLETIRARSNSMTPNGYTNLTIGYTMGLASLRSDSPFSSTSSNGADVQKFMIVLTDGDNTRNRWDSNSTAIDTRLSTACTKARTDAKDRQVTIFTIRVIEGNAALLKSCASDPSKYFNVKDASGLKPVFKKILDAIQGVRITS